MQLSTKTLAILLPLVAAKTIRVDVGLDGLSFTPNNVRADNGTEIVFHYHPKDHSVTQSSFAAPCAPLAGGKGINSGFVPIASGQSPTTFTITVENDSTPLWLYCAQTKGEHCQAGMSMVVNEPNAGSKSLAVYQALAKLTSASTIGATVQGGVLANSSSSSSSVSAAPSASAGASGHGSGGNTSVSTGMPTKTGSGGSSASGSASATGTGVATTHSGAAASGHALDWAVLGGAAAVIALAI